MTSLGVRCKFLIVVGQPFSLALLLCKNASGLCVALPLWPSRSGSDSLPLFRVGFRSSDSTYKLITIRESNIQKLRHHGWIPWTGGNTKGASSSRVNPGNGGHLEQNTSKASNGTALIRRAYITDIHPSSLPDIHHGLQLQEPHLLYIPSWIISYLDMYGLKLDSDPPIEPDKAIEPPSALRIVSKHQPALDAIEFSITFGRCGSSRKMFAAVAFPAVADRSFAKPAAQGDKRRLNTSWPSPSPAAPHFRGPGLRSPQICPKTKTHVHINSWKTRSTYYVYEKKEVRLSVTPWPAADSYCLDIGLEGEYFSSLQKLQAGQVRAQARPQPAGTSRQISEPVLPNSSVTMPNPETTTLKGHSQDSPSRRLPRHDSLTSRRPRDVHMEANLQAKLASASGVTPMAPPARNLKPRVRATTVSAPWQLPLLDDDRGPSMVRPATSRTSQVVFTMIFVVDCADTSAKPLKLGSPPVSSSQLGPRTPKRQG